MAFWQAVANLVVNPPREPISRSRALITSLLSNIHLLFLTPMTFAVLRSLHTILGEALDDIERIYASHGYSSPSDTSQYPGPFSPCSEGILNPGRKLMVSTGQAYASPPPSPSMATHAQPISPPPASVPLSGSTNPLDFPSLDAPYDQTSLSEALTTHPVVLSAISRIIAAAGQMSATVQTPFLSLCDATMGVS
jgi:hypothetical protein